MPRYFLEVAYKGTNFSGFQSQHNANTIQAELEKAFLVLHKGKVVMTGSSRTDSGVHALQNFLHFDFENKLNPALVYKMNAILPEDIVVKKLIPVAEDAHCRFDALSREYKYIIYRYKDPFLKDKGYYFPYKVDFEKLQSAASIIKEYNDFTSFSKRNTQVKSFSCKIMESKWTHENDCLVYQVKANRFLRGMVRALTATMLKVGRNNISLDDFKEIIEAKDCTKSSFAIPPHGLILISVAYSKNLISG